MKRSVHISVLPSLVLIVLLAVPISALGQCLEHEYFWVAEDSNWLVPENWEHQEWDPLYEQCIMVSGVPSSDDTVWIKNGGTANIFTEDTIDVNSIGIGVLSDGHVSQSDGTLNCSTWISVGGLYEGPADGNGSYLLQGNGELFAEDIVVAIGPDSNGIFVQTSGDVTVSRYLNIAQDVNAIGEYQLRGGELSVYNEQIGFHSTGTFVQSGGQNYVTSINLGRWGTGRGFYTLFNGTLEANEILVGFAGEGAFVQTSGNVTINEHLLLGLDLYSEGTYIMLGGTLNVEDEIIVGCEGTGSFMMDGGTVNGTTDDAELFCSSTGSLTGPGTFNIEVIYESEEAYGTDGDEHVYIAFERSCLTEGGTYDVEQLTPADFASGTVANLLESSVFDVSFDGSFCGGCAVAVPYDQAEVLALDANEMNLVVLRETGPEAYEPLPVLAIDTESDVIYALSNGFGKFAVMAMEAITVIVHGYQKDGNIPPDWTYDMRQAILNRVEETYPGMVVIVFNWAEASRQHIPADGELKGRRASDVLRREAQRLAEQLVDGHLVTADPSCHIHLIGHSRGGSLVSYAASLLNAHFGQRVVNHMTILDGIDENSDIVGWYLQDPAICGNNADWTDNYYQTNDWLHGEERPDADHNEEWEEEHHGGFAEAYTDTIIDNESNYGYYWSLGGGGWNDPAKPHGRAFCSQSGTETVINGDYETQDLLGWSTLLGSPSVVPHGADNYVCQMEEQSSVAITQTIMTPAHARFILFDFAFPDQGDGDSLIVTLGGTTVFTFLGMDFESSDLVSSGLIGISAFGGQTSCELVFTLNSVGEPGAIVLLDNIKVVTAGDSDADGDVDLSDFSIFAAHWLRDNCNAPDWCDGTDIAPEIPDGVVDILDLGILANHWLEGTVP